MLNVLASLVITDKYTPHPKIPKDDNKIKKLNITKKRNKQEFPSFTRPLMLSIRVFIIIPKINYK